MAPKVSVLVPTYNRAALLPDSLASIFSQTVPPSQVIVINDGSTDDTSRVAGKCGSRIEYLEQHPNQGKSCALNLGMQHVTGDYVWIMDDDDIALTDALERHLDLLEHRPDVDFTYSGFYVPDETGRRRLFSPPDASDPQLLLRLLKGYFMSLHGTLVRTSCYKEVGPFDPTLLRSQDYDMAIRLLYRFRCARIDGPTFAVRWDFEHRGPARDRFPFRKVLLKGTEYQQAIFRKVRRELPLRFYLPEPSSVPDELTPPERRRGLLVRASIMASKSLPLEMAEDLEQASLVPPDSPLSTAERTILWHFEWCRERAPAMFVLPRNRTVLDNASAIARSKVLRRNRLGFAIKCDLARGLYWRAPRLWRENDRLHSLSCVASACKIMGIRGIARIGLRKFLGLRTSLPLGTRTGSDKQISSGSTQA